MMTNLFSMFDPCNFSLQTSWLIPFIALFSPFLKNTSKFFTMIKKMINSLSSEFNNLTNSNFSNNFLIPLFMSILMMNLISMIPSLFMMTAQMSIVLPMALAMWLSNVIYFSIKKTSMMLTHMVPMGSPTPLMPIMVLIEIVSNLIRPITLSVRLVANITAGHLLMHLLSSFTCSMFPSTLLIMLMPTSFILNILELGVAFIQSYIMCTLIALYSNEIH